MALKTRLKFGINTKILLTLLGLSILPLILFILIFRFNMTSLERKVGSEVIEDAKMELVRLAKGQAAISNAMLDKILDDRVNHRREQHDLESDFKLEAGAFFPDFKIGFLRQKFL